MFKTLKTKFAAVYLILVIIIGIIGVFSAYNNYILGKQINSLMVRNYMSIKAVNVMSEALDEQNAAMQTYININHEEGITDFHAYKVNFDENFNVEANNITENGEEELVNELKTTYEKYLILFSELQEGSKKGDSSSSIKYYQSNIQPVFKHIKATLKGINDLNETGMFSGKDRVNNYARHSMYVIIILSSLSLILGFLVAMISLKKFLQPIYSLRETMKAIRAGDLNKQSPIISKDEVGELTMEFNNMTKRLLEFEQSTLGQLLSEKTKSMTIVKSIADPLIVLDPNYKIVLLNNACENVFGTQEKDSLNKYLLAVINNSDLYEYISSVNNSDSTDEKQKIIYMNVDQKDYYFNVIVSVLKDVQENTSGFVVLLQNVTQLKQIEKIKSDFVASISHEFKTPLTSIMIGTSLVTDEKLGELNERQKQILDTIAEDSERLLDLVNDLLNLSKIESGKSIFDIKPNSVEDIIVSSIRGFIDQAKNKSVHLSYKLENKLPKVNVDSKQITWVLNNLFSNALKYTEARDEIIVKAFVKHNKVCISVKNTGIGIPSEYQEKIFDKFVQVPGQDSEMKGTGLGLAIAREVVEAHGGEIWCESELENGTNFIFTLPLADD